MMKKALILSAILTLTILSSSIAAVHSGKSVYDSYYTWDADMINVDTVHSEFTGKGVYVAVLDTGLAPNWKDYLPIERIAAHLGKGFKENVKWDEKTGKFVESGVVYETTFIGSTGTEHGTHVTSTIIGYNYYAIQDAVAGTPLPPIYVKGMAPEVTIIPVKVLSDYHIGKAHLDDVDYTDMHLVFGTDRAVAAGIRYATDLKKAGYAPMIITMSLGVPTPSSIMEDAINYAIENDVIVVASAGNEGEDGMGWPGAYEQVISVGACGWRYEWYWANHVAPPPRSRIWWLQSPLYGYNDVPEGTADEVYITEWSSRELSNQDLDVVAPGSWVRGPYAGDPGYSHLPWWSKGYPALFNSRNPGNFYYVGGTSMSAPHVTSVVALMLQKNPSLIQSEVEDILEETALEIPSGSMTVWDLDPAQDWYTYSWGADATGAGLVQADEAIKAVEAV